MDAHEAETLHILAQIIRGWSYELIDQPYGDTRVGGTLRERMIDMADDLEREIEVQYDARNA
tara:strand:- start:877 stop:1062 length:186 start_codon:yes stop_codon:yes gene_type:complete